jgi:hypothetical protein
MVMIDLFSSFSLYFFLKIFMYDIYPIICLFVYVIVYLYKIKIKIKIQIKIKIEL